MTWRQNVWIRPGAFLDLCLASSFFCCHQSVVEGTVASFLNEKMATQGLTQLLHKTP